jgi:hypothetical protein
MRTWVHACMTTIMHWHAHMQARGMTAYCTRARACACTILSVYACPRICTRTCAEEEPTHILIDGAVHIVGHVSFADVETCTPAYTARQNRSVVHYSNKLNLVGPTAQRSFVCIAGVCMLDGGSMHTAACRPVSHRPIVAVVYGLNKQQLYTLLAIQNILREAE